DSPTNLGLPLKKWPGPTELSVHREHPFAIRTSDHILTGAIDRLVIIQHNHHPIAADILDFKTDEIPPSDKKALAERIEFYRPQMEAYCQAAAQMLKLDPRSINSRLVFLQAAAVAAA